MRNFTITVSVLLPTLNAALCTVLENELSYGYTPNLDHAEEIHLKAKFKPGVRILYDSHRLSFTQLY